MPTEQLLQQCHELRVDQFTRTLSTLPPTNAFRSRPGPSAIGKQETPVRTLDWLDAAYQSELASVRLLSDLDAHQCSDLSGLVRFSSSLDRPETAPWSTYAHGLQEERARGGLAAYLVSRIPEVAPVAPTVKALSDEVRAYAHNTSLSRLALVNTTTASSAEKRHRWKR
ncbi:hypothetical protein C5C17_13825 [Pseudoclavibacter sp. RFBA6]|nr:hypothetical protein C5C17_13825 [Pseudoclavibacter sp. RFBA6]